MPVMAAFAAVLGAFGSYAALAPLFGRVPVVVRPRLVAVTFATAFGAEVLAQALTSGLDLGFVLVAALAAAAGITLSRGAVQFLGVREEAFLAALRRTLDDLGWRYDLRVDGGERVDRIVLTEAHAGLEFRVRARDAHASLSVRGGSARDLVADVVDGMEARLRGGDAAAGLASRATYAWWAVAAVLVAITVYLI